MNGVFINGKKILAVTPLSEGDLLGVGCNDNSQEDYYVFKICRRFIKDEEVNILISFSP